MNHLSDPNRMKKMYSITKMDEILGTYVAGSEMHLYGLPYLTPSGVISEVYEAGCVEKMLAIRAFHPDIHIVTFLKDRSIVNKYQAHDAIFYKLYRGNADPEIEFVFDKDAYNQSKEAWILASQIWANRTQLS